MRSRTYPPCVLRTRVILRPAPLRYNDAHVPFVADVRSPLAHRSGTLQGGLARSPPWRKVS